MVPLEFPRTRDPRVDIVQLAEGIRSEIGLPSTGRHIKESKVAVTISGSQTKKRDRCQSGARRGY